MRLFALKGSHLLGAAVAEAMDVALDPIEERDFEAGEHKVRPLVSVRGEDVYIVCSLDGDATLSANDKLVRLLVFIATCRENGAARVTAVAPYIAYARKDRQTKPRDPVTMRYIAQLFEAVGTDTVMGLDVHNVAAFQNAFRCTTVHLDTRRLLAGALKAHGRLGETVVMSPDGGGVKRAELLQDVLAQNGIATDFALMEKRRSEGVVAGELFAGDVAGKTVIIVDDMICSGGTILRAARACRERGAKKVLAYATHGCFTDDAAELFNDSALDSVIVTDSVGPHELENIPAGKLEVISCAPLLGDAIERLHGGGSINRLLGSEI